MKTRLLKRVLCAAAMAFCGLAVPAMAGESDPAAAALQRQLQQVGPARFTAADYLPGTVRHIVLVRFRDDLPEARRQALIDAFLALRTQALRHGKPYIVSIETGPQISGEGASHGLEQAFILTFASQGDRNHFIGPPVVSDVKYGEPAHEAFKKQLKPALAQDGLVSFDFPVAAEAK